MKKVNPPGYLGRQDWLWWALTLPCQCLPPLSQSPDTMTVSQKTSVSCCHGSALNSAALWSRQPIPKSGSTGWSGRWLPRSGSWAVHSCGLLSTGRDPGPIGKPGAEAMLHLRAVYLNAWWDEFIGYHGEIPQDMLWQRLRHGDVRGTPLPTNANGCEHHAAVPRVGARVTSNRCSRRGNK